MKRVKMKESIGNKVKERVVEVITKDIEKWIYNRYC